MHNNINIQQQDDPSTDDTVYVRQQLGASSSVAVSHPRIYTCLPISRSDRSKLQPLNLVLYVLRRGSHETNINRCSENEISILR